MSRRIAYLGYGILCYAVFFGVFLYAIGFLGNFATPTTLDGEAKMNFWPALAIDLALLALFAVQHSVMARPAFKRWWIRFVPQPAERSTYVLASCVAMILLFAFWQPLGGSLWEAESAAVRTVVYGIFALGWVLLFVATFLVDHFDLFGLRQSWLAFRGRPYSQLDFKTSTAYRHVRHPIYVGWLVIFWATPTMTTAHLVFAVMTTAYILVAIQLEERDLTALHPEYAEYRRRVPMLMPSLRPRISAESTVTKTLTLPINEAGQAA